MVRDRDEAYKITKIKRILGIGDDTINVCVAG
jgi:hypothetical protein